LIAFCEANRQATKFHDMLPEPYVIFGSSNNALQCAQLLTLSQYIDGHKAMQSKERNMSSHLITPPLAINAQSSATLRPTIIFFLLSLLFLGTAAYITSKNMIEEAPYRDIWQHAAAIGSLMENLSDPMNPFVATSESSRHFHPLWVAAAWFGQSFGLTVWQVLTAASYISMILFATAVFVFARSYYTSAWGPVVLLITLLFGWVLQYQNTGFHSFSTLLYSAVYPATFLISLSFFLWAATIRSLQNRKLSLLLVPLTGIMVTTHQLGAAIGLLVAGCLLLLWPHGKRVDRTIAAGAILAGLALSQFWPYHNPLLLVQKSSDITWDGGAYFFETGFWGWAATPAIIGILGLFGKNARPMLLALAMFCVLFAIGFLGYKIAGRFLMPIILLLHVGMASFILSGGLGLVKQERVRDTLGSAGLGIVLVLFIWNVSEFQTRTEALRPVGPSTFESAQVMVEDIPKTEEVAVHGIAAWPVVANGQRVLSIPWPEPGIQDLGTRQASLSELFGDAVSWEQRLRIAKSLNVKTAIVDDRLIHPTILAQFSEKSVAHRRHGMMWRFDLY